MKIFLKVTILILFCITIFIGCSSGENPKDVVSAFLKCYVDNNVTGMQQYAITENTIPIVEEYKGFYDDMELDFDSFNFLSDFYDNELIWAIAAKLKYSVRDESIENDIATVTISIETPNMKDITQKFLSNESMQKFSESEINGEFLKEISNSILVKNELQLHLQMVDGKWLINLESFDVMDKLSGGLLSAYRNLYQSAIDEFKQQIEEASR